MATMGRLGRERRGDPALDDLLDGVAAVSHLHLRLALVAAAAAGRFDRVRRALAHPTPGIRRFALSLLPATTLAVEDADRILRDGSTEDRRVLRRRLRTCGSAAIADACIDLVLAERGDREAASMLAACSPAVAARLLPELVDALPSIAGFARRHPEAVLDLLAVALPDDSARERDERWGRTAPALPALVLAAPDRVLDLLTSAPPTTIVPTAAFEVLGRLIRTDAERVAALISHPDFVDNVGWRLPPTLLRNAHRFTPADQGRIALALRDQDHHLTAWLDALLPSARPAAFDAAFDGVDTTTRRWPNDLLDALPRDLRHREAARMLTLRAVQGHETQVDQVAAFLAWPEARDRLAPRTHAPDADVRADAWRLLIAAARRDRSTAATTEVLDLALGLRNEQDPVRHAALSTLATLPAVHVTGADLDRVDSICRDAIAARDASPGTLQQVTAIATGLLAAGWVDPAGADDRRVEVGVTLIEQVAAASRFLPIGSLDRTLPSGAEGPLIDGLAPLLTLAAARGDHQPTLTLWRSLGRRAWRSATLASLLEAATRAPDTWVATTAIGAWLADPATRVPRADGVVGDDPSALTLPSLLRIAAGPRPDLLDRILGGTGLGGRFFTGGIRYVPLFDRGPERWLPRRVGAYRRALDALLADPGTAGHARTSAIRALARLPQIGADAVQPHLASADVATSEAAFTALAWTDEPDRWLTTLLAEARGDQARVAMSAASRAARFTADRAVREPLHVVLASTDAKVTARKEAARILGATRASGAVGPLAEVGTEPGTHRDVWIAIAQTALAFLDDPRAWAVLDVALLDPTGDRTEEQRSLLAVSPRAVAPRHRQRYAALVADLAITPDARLRRDAMSAIATWSRWNPTAWAVAADAVSALDDPAWHEALAAVGRMLDDGRGWDGLEDLARRLAARATTDDLDPVLDAATERDRPADRRIRALVDTVAACRPEVRRHRAATVLALVTASASTIPRPADDATLTLAAIDWSSPSDRLIEVASLVDRWPRHTAPVLERVTAALERDRSTWDPAMLGSWIDAAAAAGGDAPAGASIVAVALTRAAGDRSGWPEPWRDRLRALRRHVDPEVARFAIDVATAAE